MSVGSERSPRRVPIVPVIGRSEGQREPGTGERGGRVQVGLLRVPWLWVG